MGAEGGLQEVASSGKAVVRIKESEEQRSAASMERDKTGLERQIREMNEKLLEMRELLHNQNMLQT